MLPVILVLLLLVPATASAQIPETPDSDPPPTFTGNAWTAQPVFAPPAPRHPFMAPNQRSNVHSDAFQTDTNVWSGPLGNDLEVISHYEPPGGVCGSITFNSQNQIISTCLQVRAVRLKLFDAQTLEELASMELPPRPPNPNPFQDFAGGGYFYLDNQDRAVVPTTERHVLVVGVKDGEFAVEQDYDLSDTIPSGSKIISALPDWKGRIWLATIDGLVVVIDPATGEVKTHDLGEVVQNSFAVGDRSGVYIVSAAALYRFKADASGAPLVKWRKVYENTGEQKPGQVSAGSGTTPTLHGDNWVSITDNADPMNVVVYKRRNGKEICRQPVFEQGAGSTDNSLIGAGHSIIVENNYGYTGPTATTMGGRTEPGVERVDIDADGVGLPQGLALRRDLAHAGAEALARERPGVRLHAGPTSRDPDDPWFLTALDFRTGKTVWERLTGQGIAFNNNYAPVTIGPDGTAYVGVLGGLLLVRDKTAPAQDIETRPKIKLRAKRRGERVVFRATAPSGGVVAPVHGAVVRAGGQRALTNRKGKARIKVAGGRARAKKTGYRRGTAKVPR